MKIRTTIGILAVAAMTLTACGDPSGGGSGSSDEIVLGASLSLTGPLGGLGQNNKAGYEYAVEKINADGGIEVDGEKVKVKLVVLDNQSDPSLASSQARELVLKEGATALLGACTPPISIPIAQVAEKEKVPMVGSCLPTHAFLEGSESGWEYAWNIFFTEEDQATTAIKMFDQLQSNKKVAVFTDTQPDGIVERELYKKAAADAGYEVVGDYSFPVGTTDFASFVTDAKSKGAQLVIAQAPPPESIALWKAMKALELKPVAAFSAKSAAGQAWKELAEVGNGTLTEGFWSPTGGFPDAEELEKDLPADLLPTVGDRGIAVLNLTDVMVIADAITEAGSAEADAINEAIGKTDKTYPAGPVKFENNAAVTPHFGLQWVDGEMVQVEPNVGTAIVSPTTGLQ